MPIIVKALGVAGIAGSCVVGAGCFLGFIYLNTAENSDPQTQKNLSTGFIVVPISLAAISIAMIVIP